MRPDQPQTPGRAFAQILVLAAFTAIFWEWGSQPGWEPALVGVVIGALGLLRAFIDLTQALRVWSLRRALEEEAHTPSNRFTTRDSDHSADPPDGWL